MSQSISSFIFIKVFSFDCGEHWFWLSGPIAHAIMGNIHHYSIEIEFHFWVFSFSISRASHRTVVARSPQFSTGNEHRSHSMDFTCIMCHKQLKTISFSHSPSILPRPKCTIKLMQSHFRHKNDSSWQIIGLALALFRFISLRHFDRFFFISFLRFHLSFVAIVACVSIFPCPCVHSTANESKYTTTTTTTLKKKIERNCIN